MLVQSPPPNRQMFPATPFQPAHPTAVPIIPLASSGSPISSPLVSPRITSSPPSSLPPTKAGFIPTNSHSQGEPPMKPSGRIETSSRRYALSDSRPNAPMQQSQQTPWQPSLNQQGYNQPQPKPSDSMRSSGTGPARPARPLAFVNEVEASVELERHVTSIHTFYVNFGPSPRTKNRKNSAFQKSLCNHYTKVYKLVLGLESRFFQCRSPCSLVSQVAVKMSEVKLKDVTIRSRPRSLVRFIVLTPRALYFYKTSSVSIFAIFGVSDPKIRIPNQRPWLLCFRLTYLKTSFHFRITRNLPKMFR